MIKDNVTHLQTPIEKQISDFISSREAMIAECDAHIQRVNYFALGFVSGTLITCIIFACVYFFIG
jgi:hypothetical protein